MGHNGIGAFDLLHYNYFKMVSPSLRSRRPLDDFRGGRGVNAYTFGDYVATFRFCQAFVKGNYASHITPQVKRARITLSGIFEPE